MKKFFIALCLVLTTIPAFTQDKPKDKDAQIKELQFKNENLEIEAAFHEASSQQKDAQSQVDKLSNQLQLQLMPYSAKLLEALAKAQKDQNVPADWTYSMVTHKWEKPLPVKAPDGSPAATPAATAPVVPPVTKPEIKPEPKK